MQTVVVGQNGHPTSLLAFVAHVTHLVTVQLFRFEMCVFFLNVLITRLFNFLIFNKSYFSEHRIDESIAKLINLRDKYMHTDSRYSLLIL